jgi:hypothetical protein
MRTQAAPKAEKLWQALRRSGPRGLTALDAAERHGVSEPYARRALRVWTQAGYADRHDAAPGDPGYFTMKEEAPERPPILSATNEVEPREGYMTPAEFAAVRRFKGLSLRDFGRALGHIGVPETLSREMRRYETGKRPISKDLADKVKALAATPQNEKSPASVS